MQMIPILRQSRSLWRLDYGCNVYILRHSGGRLEKADPKGYQDFKNFGPAEVDPIEQG